MEKDRHYPRLNLSCDMEYSIDTTAGPQAPEGTSSKTKDISVGGMCFITYVAIPIGTTIKLKLKLKDNEKLLEVTGKIVWTEKFNIGGQLGWDNGIQFLDIPEKSKVSILKYIDSML